MLRAGRATAAWMGLLALAGVANAATHINVGNTNLLPETPGQVVTLKVTNDPGTTPPQVTDFSGYFQIGPNTLDQPVPVFQGANFTGTFFAGTGSQGGGGPEAGAAQLMQAGYSVSSGSVPANGNLINLIIDTTGFSAGTFDLKLHNTAYTDQYSADSSFLPSSANDGLVITNGFITIAPEPSAALLAALAATSLTLGRCRRSDH